METRLYIPFTDLEINRKKGEVILYENLVQSGPAYKLIVHESPAWVKIKDEMPWPEMVEIISKEKAEQYKEIANRFFSPITEAVPFVIIEGKRYPTSNLVTDHKRALSYILIAHDYKARIYEDDILECTSWTSDQLKKHQNTFSDEAIKSAEFVENLLVSYKRSTIDALSISEDERIFKDLMDLLKEEEMKFFSEKNHLFGVVNARKDVLKREIKERATKIVKNEWLPYLVGGITVTLGYFASLKDMLEVLTFLSSFGAKILSKFDFREYAPPIQNPKLFKLASPESTVSFHINHSTTK